MKRVLDVPWSSAPTNGGVKSFFSSRGPVSLARLIPLLWYKREASERPAAPARAKSFNGRTRCCCCSMTAGVFPFPVSFSRFRYDMISPTIQIRVVPEEGEN